MMMERKTIVFAVSTEFIVVLMIQNSSKMIVSGSSGFFRYEMVMAVRQKSRNHNNQPPLRKGQELGVKQYWCLQSKIATWTFYIV